MREASALKLPTFRSFGYDGAPSPLMFGRARPTAGSTAGARWLNTFVIWDLLAQVGMFWFGDSAVVRLPLRIGVYAASLAMLFVTIGRRTKYPPRRVLPIIIAILSIEQLHPGGDRPFAQTAQLALYVAVLGPLIWVPRLRLADPMQKFRRVILLMWIFYTTSAVMGVLQVKYPGHFEGALSANFTTKELYVQGSIAPHIFTLADGTQILRPTGLSDMPGGAALAGVYSIMFGMGLLLSDRRIWIRPLTIGGMVAGLFCIYICQQRTNLVIVAISACVLLVVLIRRQSLGRAGVLLIVITAVAAAGTTAAFAIGGASTVARFNTLVAEDAGTVVYKNRGVFLDQMLREDLLTYPLGAGMGRWGMMNLYFGGHTQPLWAEMMWQALLFDGGWLLVCAYATLLFIVVRVTWKIAIRARGQDLGTWAGVVCGCNVSAISASFVFPVFSVSMGLEIFLLNACLYAAFVEDQRGSRHAPPAYQKALIA